ncbi:MAG: tetratricopeptide repeat protein [Candidatus Omnitrophota bacterium]|jgi:tetratricopeptide (TPR) repeat protein
MRNEDISVKLKPHFFQKIILIFIGILLSIVLLEVGMRAAEFILQSLQEYRNMLSIRKNGEYRIICIGESTTAGQYPHFLEEALNQYGIGIKFSVIDKGIGATDTSFILGQLENNIKKYQPDLVVAMIGTNDGASHMPIGFSTDSKAFFKSLKIYRLAKLIILHIQSKIKAFKSLARKNNKLPITSLKNNQPPTAPLIYKQNIQNAVMSVGVNETINKEGIKEVSKESIEESVKESTKDSIKEGIKETELKDDNFFNDLGQQLTAQGDFHSASQAFEKAISLNPYNVDAYFRLAVVSDQNKGNALLKEICDRYKSLIKTGIPDNEQSANIGHLCRVLVGKEMYLEVEELCKEMLAKNLLCIEANIILARSSLEQGKYAAAEEFFKRVIELDNSDSRAFDGLAVVYHETRRFNLRDQYLRRANELRPRYPLLVTIRNYKKIKNILDKNKIQLLCVQYPMRSIEPLKKIFEGEKNVIFVDNEQVFKNAVAKGLYKDFFRDMFAGDFGHCTDKGNRLLAENIAKVIAKEIFHK